MPAQCLISFGSNLGDRGTVVARAARLIDQSGVVMHGRTSVANSFEFASDGLQTSRLFETPPIGGPGGQSPFLNAVGAFSTDASAAEVLDVLQRTEIELGRLRKDRWGARSIDLDVVLHGRLLGTAAAGRRGLIGGRGPVGSANALVVPHPRYTARKFVVEPACDVAADFCDPRFGWTMADLLRHLNAAVPSMALAGGDEDLRREICDRLSREHSIAIIDAEAVVSTQPDSTSEYRDCQPWISPTVPQLLQSSRDEVKDSTPVPTLAMRLPRLIARIDRTTEATRWPAPHRMWPSSWRWPEYRLEVDDLEWAVGEIASGLDSMQCAAEPVTDDGNWW